MVTKVAVDDFVAQRTLAIVGVSRSGRKFGNVAARELRAKGYDVYCVHPLATSIDGQPCYPSLASLPARVGGVLVVVPPAQAAAVVREAVEAGITRIWLQQGAESEDAVRFCESHGVPVVSGHCILMFADPTAWHHRAHRWIWALVGRLPQEGAAAH